LGRRSASVIGDLVKGEVELLFNQSKIAFSSYELPSLSITGDSIGFPVMGHRKLSGIFLLDEEEEEDEDDDDDDDGEDEVDDDDGDGEDEDVVEFLLRRDDPPRREKLK